MAGGGTIIVSGNAGDNIGAFMHNGEIIIAGNTGKGTGQYMTGGVIYIGGNIHSQGINTETRDLTDSEKKKIVKYFKHYGISKNVNNFKKIIPIKNSPLLQGLFYTQFVNREQVPKSIIDDIESSAKTGLMTLYGPSKDFITNSGQSFYDRLSILPEQIKTIENWDKLDLDFTIAQKIGGSLKSPLVLNHPFYLESRGPGTVSTSTQMAFLYAANESGSALNLGGLMLQDEFGRQAKYNNKLITQWGPHRMGIEVDYLSKSSAIELVLGYGGSGSLPMIIPKNKITNELSKLWNVTKSTDILLPPKSPDFDVPADLKRHVELLREISGYRIPILIRMAAGDVYEDTKLAIRAGADAIVIDCIDSFRQNLPTITANNLGLFSIAAIGPAAKAIKDTKAVNNDFKLIVSGFFRNGGDIYKALALGADAVVINTPAEIGIGCKLCGKCNLNNCPVGIGTTNPKFETKLDWVEAGKKMAKYLRTVIMEFKLLMLLTGCKNTSDINRDKLRSFDYEVASITGVRLGGFDKRLPMWDH
jgi:glutamate synthase domain-containing protein 2